MPELWINGQPASADDLIHQVLHPYGAFTSFRIERGGARGLDLHLARLVRSSDELFGVPVSEDLLRERMRQALGGRSEAWLRISLFSRDIWMRQADAVVEPGVMVAVFDPPAALAGDLRLHPQTYSREAAHLKHAATFGLMRARRLARQAGYDDALFVDEDGAISEGSVWNIGFLQGDHVVWPEAAMLAGVAQAVIRKGLNAAGWTDEQRVVRLEDLDQFDGAFICNSATPAAGVTAIGSIEWAADSSRTDRLGAIWAAAPVENV